MRCIVVCECDNSEGKTKYLSANLGKRLYDAGHVAAYMRVEPYINTRLTDADPSEYGEIYVLSDGSEVPKVLGIYERACQAQLTGKSYVTIGYLISSALATERSEGLGSKLLDIYVSMKMVLRRHIKDLLRQSMRYNAAGDWASSEPDALLIDIDEKVFTRAGCDLHKILFDILQEQFEDDVTIINTTNINLNKLVSSKWNIHQLSSGDASTTMLMESITPLESSEEEMLLRNDKIFKVGLVVGCDVQADPYCCVREALHEAGRANGVKIEIVYLDLRKIEQLEDVEGIVMPGGFGGRFVEEKLKVIKYARENNVPFLGICLGFQLAIIEYARNVLGISAATSEEFDAHTAEPIIMKAPDIMCKNTGYNMYLGAYEVKYRGPGKQIYGEETPKQKFRHRYMVNANYLQLLEDAGMRFCGKSTEERLVMFVVEDHRFFCGVQYHPELSPMPGRVDSVFRAYISSIIGRD